MVLPVVLRCPVSATYRLVPLLSMAIPPGALNSAAVPVPSAWPAAQVVLPARVVTTPVAMTIRRMLLPLRAATYRLVPLLSMAKPLGPLNVAAVPVPSALPAAPVVLPARVVTTAEAMTIRRMVWLVLSATYRLVPLLSMARPVGRLNRAAVPVPSTLPAVPAVLPARVVTTPVAMTIRRMLLPPRVDTYRLVPLLSMTKPPGWLNVAAAPVPSALPAAPEPASVVTTPWGRLNSAAAPVPSTLPDVPAVPARVLTTPAGVILRMVWLFLAPAVYRLPALSRTKPNWGENPATAAVP